jgi:hypothetical protein
VLEAPPRYPLKGGVLVSNRGRVDARFIDGEYSWRFRSRLSVEKEFSIGPVRMNPYVRGELFSDSRFGKWSRTEWIGGAAFPLNRPPQVPAASSSVHTVSMLRCRLMQQFDGEDDDCGRCPNTVLVVGEILPFKARTSTKRHRY